MRRWRQSSHTASAVRFLGDHASSGWSRRSSHNGLSQRRDFPRVPQYSFGCIGWACRQGTNWDFQPPLGGGTPATGPVELLSATMPTAGSRTIVLSFHFSECGQSRSFVMAGSHPLQVWFKRCLYSWPLSDDFGAFRLLRDSAYDLTPSKRDSAIAWRF